MRIMDHELRIIGPFFGNYGGNFENLRIAFRPKHENILPNPNGHPSIADTSHVTVMDNSELEFKVQSVAISVD